MLRTLSAFVLVGVMSLNVAQASGPAIINIQEDWELVLGDPDPNVVGPQITCVIAPVGHAEGIYATVNLNHQDRNGFVPGGIQLQLWNGSTEIGSQCDLNLQTLDASGEAIHWTQEMTLTPSDRVRFSIRDGHCDTWGNFGPGLACSVPTSLQSLNEYDPEVSLSNSGTVFAANRVASLKLLRVRIVYEGGQVNSLELNRSVE